MLVFFKFTYSLIVIILVLFNPPPPSGEGIIGMHFVRPSVCPSVTFCVQAITSHTRFSGIVMLFILLSNEKFSFKHVYIEHLILLLTSIMQNLLILTCRLFWNKLLQSCTLTLNAYIWILFKLNSAFQCLKGYCWWIA